LYRAIARREVGADDPGLLAAMGFRLDRFPLPNYTNMA
jgi:hypothetical protein